MRAVTVKNLPLLAMLGEPPVTGRPVTGQVSIGLFSAKVRPALAAFALAGLGGGVGLAQTLPEVVVSASRAEQLSFDAPAGIQSVARTQIQSAGPQVNLSEALKRVPGLTILERQNYAQDLQLSIRGFGARSAFRIRGIRLLVDGIPARSSLIRARFSFMSPDCPKTGPWDCA